MQIRSNNVLNTILVSVLAGAGSSLAQADTIHVPAGGDIQAAIDIAASGDVVQLEKGYYFPSSTLDTLGKAITVRGEADRSGDPSSVIDGQRSKQVLQCLNGEGQKTVFDTLKIVNGYVSFGSTNGGGTSGGGGGMYIEDSSPTISNCHFEDNRAAFGGGGLWVESKHRDHPSNPTIINSEFKNNESVFTGGGVVVRGDYSNVRVANSLFESNLSSGAITMGGGLSVLEANVTIENCVFRDNVALGGTGGVGGALSISGGSTVEVIDSQLENNTADEGGGIFLAGGNTPILTNTTVCGNTPDQIRWKLVRQWWKYCER